MESILGNMHNVLTIVVEIGIFLVEMIGIFVLLFTSVKSFIMWLHKEDVALFLAHGIALALSFKMGGEVLRTVIVREWNELIILGAIIFLRGILALLINWEIKNEEKKNEKV